MDDIELIKPIVLKLIEEAKLDLHNKRGLLPKLNFILFNPYTKNAFNVEIPAKSLVGCDSYTALKAAIEDVWNRFQMVAPKELPMGAAKLLCICFIIDSWRVKLKAKGKPIELAAQEHKKKYGTVCNDPNKTDTIIGMISTADAEYVGFYDYKKPRVDAKAEFTYEDPINFTKPLIKSVVGIKRYPG